ncbi:MAG: hypothetical protein GY909_10145 [Oligoflexia bacterium]|nr:hypothetical protein [Oligoflexia bacterium]
MQWPRNFNDQLKIIQNNIEIDNNTIIFLHEEKLHKENKFFNLIDYLMDGVLSKQIASGQEFDQSHGLSGKAFNRDFHILYISYSDGKDWASEANKYLKILANKESTPLAVSICSDVEKMSLKKLQDSHKSAKFQIVSFGQ